MTRFRLAVPLLAAAALLATASACSARSISVTTATGTPPRATAAARPTSPVSRPSPASATTPAASMTSSTPRDTTCPDGPVTLTHNPGDSRNRSACARSGAAVTITLLPARGYRWTPLQSSDPDVATVIETHVDADGTGHAVIRAGQAGTATITSSDTYTPDRFGPPTRLWALQLEIR